jgi:hypothetical protein
MEEKWSPNAEAPLRSPQWRGPVAKKGIAKKGF